MSSASCVKLAVASEIIPCKLFTYGFINSLNLVQINCVRINQSNKLKAIYKPKVRKQLKKLKLIYILHKNKQ